MAKDRNVHDSIKLIAYLLQSATAYEVEGIQQLLLPNILAVLVVDVHKNSLHDPVGTILEVLELVDVLISTSSSVVGVDHFQKSIK